MSKYKVGDKFIIELAEAYHVRPGETRAKGENIAGGSPVTLFRIKGFKAATWDDAGLDKLVRVVDPEPEELPFEPIRPKRGWRQLMENPGDLTEEELDRWNRIQQIPEEVRMMVDEEIKRIRTQVMLLEKNADILSDYVNGYPSERGLPF